MAFEFETRDTSIAFPCSLCKKNNQSYKICRDTCGIYSITYMESIDLKNDVQKLIDGCRKHPNKAI